MLLEGASVARSRVSSADGHLKMRRRIMLLWSGQNDVVEEKKLQVMLLKQRRDAYITRDAFGGSFMYLILYSTRPLVVLDSDFYCESVIHAISQLRTAGPVGIPESDVVDR